MIGSFANRLFVVMLAVVICVLGVATLAGLQAVRSEALWAANQNLEVGQRVFLRLLTNREEQLATGVKVLASDFGFKEAIATGDDATIQSVLANHGSRIYADLAAFVGPDGALGPSTHELTTDGGRDGENWRRMLARARDEGAATAFVNVPSAGAFQIVVTPVFAPQRIGYVTVGFRMNDELAESLKSLTGLEVSFAARQDNRSVMLASTLDAVAREALAASTELNDLRPAAGTSSRAENADYLTLATPLTENADDVFAILQEPLAEAIAAFDRLLRQQLIIFALAVAAAIIVARLVAAGVTQPVKALAGAARRIAAGQYGEPIKSQRADELGLLSKAFDDMQEGIADREARIIHQSNHDLLTGLPNRRALTDRISVALKRNSRAGQGGVVMLIDIVGFKAINDALGNPVGDRVLRDTAERLTKIAREADTVSRFSSNGFVVLAEETGNEDARSLANRLVSAFEKPLQIDDVSVKVQVSIGISLYPENGSDSETLLRRAEIAMYAARSTGDVLAFYQPGQDEDHLRKLRLIKELTVALDQNALQVYFQPKLDIATGRVTQAEALVRWHHDELGMITPDEFIPIAEQSGLIGQLTRVVLDNVARHIRQWRSAGKRVVISVNISALDLTDDSLLEFIDALLQRYDVSASHIVLEVTESAVMENPRTALRIMEKLREAGFLLSIDDFGTGQSSLAQLKNMPVDELKIDKSFVLNLPDSADDAIIVKSTIALAHAMGLKVVAEGVENNECLTFLAANGCEKAQGYGISKPLPPGQFLEWLEQFDAPNESNTINETIILETDRVLG